MSQVEAYDATKHEAMIQRWHEGWKVPIPSPSRLPRIGFIVQGRAAGWLMQTDTDIAYAVDLIADPDCDERLRGLAVYAVIKELKHVGELLQFRIIRVLTKIEGVASIVERLGGKIYDDVKVIEVNP